jgi:hypothetical protein
MDWKKCIDIDMTASKSDENARSITMKYAAIYPIRGDVRLATGRIYTDEEWEARKKRVIFECNQFLKKLGNYEKKH